MGHRGSRVKNRRNINRYGSCGSLERLVAPGVPCAGCKTHSVAQITSTQPVCGHGSTLGRTTSGRLHSRRGPPLGSVGCGSSSDCWVIPMRRSRWPMWRARRGKDRPSRCWRRSSRRQGSAPVGTCHRTSTRSKNASPSTTYRFQRPIWLWPAGSSGLRSTRSIGWLTIAVFAGSPGLRS